MGPRESDEQYFSRRFEEESAAAAIATSQEARIAHLELAARYAQFAAAIHEVEERLGIGPAADIRAEKIGLQQTAASSATPGSRPVPTG